MSKREIAFEQHKPARTNFVRRIVNVYGKNDLWQTDLAEMIPYSRKNRGYKYIIIDCFTKYAWVIPLKSKTTKEITIAMSRILINRSPKLLQLDNRKEFYNTAFDELMKKYDVKKYSIFSTTKHVLWSGSIVC
ncbi:Integrase, catalytic core,Ribonuclease H-like domain [Cinara cedri]|uniref:Integrase, catalytic core,Ribonuclease H-like domain n=1 Tax=Cinara cedri TaxID=506608 RepID=A0A5E4NR46_9HEMI|nr:Integrase, catalytic core,Ribonuclease H-like domain [Cinara cedri]